MPTAQYQVGDVLLCHKHIGVAKFIGKLHQNDYLQLSTKSQSHFKPSDIWIGLQLAEEPNIKTLSAWKPHSKHSKSAKAISYQLLNNIAFEDYFSAHYGLLIPHKLVHKKVNPYQILTKLTEVFHSLKKTQRQNEKLKKKVKRLQSKLNTIKTTKKVKSTSQKSLESIIYDKNGNSYHHKQKITHTTTHSFKSSHRPFNHSATDDHHADHEYDDESVEMNPHEMRPQHPIANNSNKRRNSKTLPSAEPDKANTASSEPPMASNSNLIISIDHSPNDTVPVDGDAGAASIGNASAEQRSSAKCPSDDASLSEKATDGVDDVKDDRYMSDPEELEAEEEKINHLVVEHRSQSGSPIQGNNVNKPTLTDILSHHSFKPADIINEDNEEDYNIQHNEGGEDVDAANSANGTRSSHTRRYSAPYSMKKIQNHDFGSDYEKMIDPYWRNSGAKNAQFQRNCLRPLTPEPNPSQSDNGRSGNAPSFWKQDHDDNMLPMVKEDPVTNRIYRVSRIGLQATHKRAASMNVVNVPRYFFDTDNGEFPDLPADL